MEVLTKTTILLHLIDTLISMKTIQCKIANIIKISITLCFIILGNSFIINAQKATEYYSEGNKKLYIKDYEGAIENYSKAIDLSSKFADAYFNRGIAYVRINEYNKGIDDFTKVISLDSSSFDVFFHRAYSNFQLNNWERCIDDCNKAILINPNYGIAYSYRGVAKYQLGNQSGGCLDCDTAIFLSKDSSSKKFCFYNRGYIKKANSNFKSAIYDFSEAIALDTSFYILSYINRAKCKEELQDYIGAIDDYSSIINKFPEIYLLYIDRANVKLKLNDKIGACEDFQKAQFWDTRNDEKNLAKLIKKNCGSVSKKEEVFKKVQK